MKKRIAKFAIFLFTFIFLFTGKVYANSYGIFFKTSAGNTLKNGDVIELTAGISAVAENADPITNEKLLLLYDKNVFDLVKYDSEHPCKLRDGWEYRSIGNRGGELEVTMEASNSNYYITSANASSNTLDNIDAVLLTYKLKVKDVSNQNTKIQVIDNINYVEELNFTIHNASSNNFLSTLKVENYELDNEFNKNKTDYEVYVPFNEEKVNIIATTEDSKAKLTGTGEKTLSVGDNKVNIVVTAEDGSKRTYTINIVRKAANDDTSLSKVLVTDSNKKKVPLAYDEKTKTYTGDVTSEITFVSFDIKCSGEDCFVDELDSESLLEGRNEFKFGVTSQKGEKEEYKIVINKEMAKKNNTILYLSIGLCASILLCVVLLVLYLRNRNK